MHPISHYKPGCKCRCSTKPSSHDGSRLTPTAYSCGYRWRTTKNGRLQNRGHALLLGEYAFPLKLAVTHKNAVRQASAMIIALICTEPGSPLRLPPPAPPHRTVSAARAVRRPLTSTGRAFKRSTFGGGPAVIAIELFKLVPVRWLLWRAPTSGRPLLASRFQPSCVLTRPPCRRRRRSGLRRSR
jgi:hypothetical protein